MDPGEGEDEVDASSLEDIRAPWRAFGTFHSLDLLKNSFRKGTVGEVNAGTLQDIRVRVPMDSDMSTCAILKHGWLRPDWHGRLLSLARRCSSFQAER